MIALTCFVALTYLAVIRRERLLVYWAVAWGLLVLRFIWNIVWGFPWPAPWVGVTANVLRVGFGATLLVGALSLRGRRIPLWWIVAAATVTPALGWLLDGRIAGVRGPAIPLWTMAAFVVTAAALLFRSAALPRFERTVAAVALATYGLSSALVAQAADGSEALRVLTMVGWATQLLVGISVLAAFFRSSYEAELESRRRMETSLTEALSGFVHICIHCRAIRDGNAGWRRLEEYVAARTPTVFSHELCGDCARTHYGD